MGTDHASMVHILGLHPRVEVRGHEPYTVLLVYAIPMQNASSGKARGHVSRFGGSKQFLAGVSAKLGRGSKVEVWPMPSLIADGRDANNTRG